MKKISVILLLVALAAFVIGLAHLFKLRFEAGDIYPKYSSLRADPLGTKALFESLGDLVVARRNYRPLSKLGAVQKTTLFYLGVKTHDLRFTPEEFRGLERFVADGGRLVISFFPSYQSQTTNRFPARITPPASGGPTNLPPWKQKNIPIGADEFEDSRTVFVTERWGLDYGFDPMQKDERGIYQPVLAFRNDSLDLPQALSCHTSLFFTQLDKTWRIIYARTNEQPVLIERDYGAGTVVLSADSFYFSNEALRKERQPELLAWLVGPGQDVVFDETHLGVEENPGLASLARKYRLHSFFAGLILLAGLFIWKNSARFMPPYEEELQRAQGDLVAGKESAAGFVNLLRRNIAAPNLLTVCIEEWKKSCRRGVPLAKLERIQAVIDSENKLPSKERNPVRTYQSISQILKRKT